MSPQTTALVMNYTLNSFCEILYHYTLMLFTIKHLKERVFPKRLLHSLVLSISQLISLVWYVVIACSTCTIMTDITKVRAAILDYKFDKAQ